MTLLVVAVTVWLMLGVLGGLVGDRKGMVGTGFWLGFLLGPVGLVVIAVLPATKPRRQPKALLVKPTNERSMRHPISKRTF